MLLIINNVSVASSWFQVIGDVTNVLAAGDYIQVRESTGNDGVYQLAAAAYSSGVTRLTTIEPVTSAVPDGFLSMGVYDLKFSNDGIDGKDTIVIAPYGTDETTSLKFNGKASLNFGEWQQENLLHLLENFASNVPPANPTIGQHWHDHTNSVTKTFVSGSVWSTDVNVEGGVLSFKDPQHPAPNTKYFLTAAEPAGKVGSGVSLYPAVNPASGNTLFRVLDADGSLRFSVQYDGKTTSANPLEITSTAASDFAGQVIANSSGTGTTGLQVTKNIVVVAGDVLLDTNKSLMVTGGGRVTLTNAVTLRGTAALGGVIIQSTGGVAVATFADNSIVFAQTVTVPTLTATDINTSNLDVSGAATIETATIETLAVTTEAVLPITSVTELTVSTSSVLASASATTLTVSGNATLNSATAVGLTVSGTTSLNTATASSITTSSLEATGTATLATAVITSGTITTLITTSADIATGEVGDLTVTGAAAFDGPVTISLAPTQPLHASNKAYVDQVSTELSAQTQHQLIAIWTGI